MLQAARAHRSGEPAGVASGRARVWSGRRGERAAVRGRGEREGREEEKEKEKWRKEWKKGKGKKKEKEKERERFAAKILAATTMSVGHAWRSQARAAALVGSGLRGTRGTEGWNEDWIRGSGQGRISWNRVQGFRRI